jgi:hypothetical protein
LGVSNWLLLLTDFVSDLPVLNFSKAYSKFIGDELPEALEVIIPGLA